MFELDLQLSEQGFLGYFIQNAPKLMWFLGAGASRTAGMPTATDITWDLKRKYYCLQENQNLQNHDINNQAIRQKIQSYMDSKGFPPLGTLGEYSFYFDLIFGQDYSSQQGYINDHLNIKKISLNVGHRIFAALLEMGLARVVFTTNFDEVVETAFSNVTGKNLPAFHLEGAYAALDALNAERFPIYAKIHGDFRYKHIKNLSADLINNDKDIQKCFLAASSRYGLIITGYSGRDANVMAMFNAALQQNNPFPQGVFWTTPRLTDITPSVVEFIKLARSKGIRAHVVETGTFDIMLSKIWRQTLKKPEKLDLKVRSSKSQRASIKLPTSGTLFPLLRTNALPITECPRKCAVINYSMPVMFQELKDKKRELQPGVIMSYTDPIMFWGDSVSVYKFLDKTKIREIKSYIFENPIESIALSSNIKAFFEEALVESMCHDKPLVVRRRSNTHYAVISRNDLNNSVLQQLKNVLGYQGKAGAITGLVPGLADANWAEALSIKMEERNGFLWLLIRPEIWITPLTLREKARDFLRSKITRRYNNQSYQLLDAWIKILFGSIGSGEEVQVTCFPNSDFAATFKINTRTGFSLGQGLNG